MTVSSICGGGPPEPESGWPGFVANGERFWCHQGMRIVMEWRHPSGVTVPRHSGAFVPPVVSGVPYRVDGSAGELCAGWAARRRAIEAKSQGGEDSTVGLTLWVPQA